MTVRIMVGDCITSMRTLIAEGARVQTVVTSPPYFGLRDYGCEGQIGLEATPAEFIARLVAVFEVVRELLADDGTLWMNMGDSYGDKQLLGMPWRLAFALQDAGWYLRQDIIWSKPNPMPESVTDRCTKAHEYLFLLTKSPRYYFDSDAIRENAASSWDPNDTKAPDGWDTGPGGHGTIHRAGREAGRSGNKARQPASARGVPPGGSGNVAGSVPWEGSTRNKRSVWTIATQPFSEAHFAVFPPKLVEPCILAGSRPGDLVLDPFGGSGTTGLVADALQRNAVLCELNPEYAAMARRRIIGAAPLFAEVA